jgi:hypothetical protein
MKINSLLLVVILFGSLLSEEMVGEGFVFKWDGFEYFKGQNSNYVEIGSYKNLAEIVCQDTKLKKLFVLKENLELLSDSVFNCGEHVIKAESAASYVTNNNTFLLVIILLKDHKGVDSLMYVNGKMFEIKFIDEEKILQRSLVGPFW